MRQLLLAISFLTIIPAYGSRQADDREMAGSLAFYPLVGLIIGVLLATLAYGSSKLGLGMGGTALVLVFWMILTAGLHLDGLMDTADGLFSGRERERKLEIMRDSRVGAMGAVALAALLILKFSFLSLLLHPAGLWVLVMAPAFGRFMMLPAIYCFPYARTGPGLGKTFAEHVNRVHMLIAAATLLLGAYLLAGFYGLLLIGAAAVPVALITAWIAHQLGGLTGDTYGAVCEISETVFLITAVAAGRLF